MAGEKTLAQELEAQGWIRQFTVETERADEYVELYESLGNEVRVEPVTPDLQVALRPAPGPLAQGQSGLRVPGTKDQGLGPEDQGQRAQDVAEECATCLLAAGDRYVVIYTRSRGCGDG